MTTVHVKNLTHDDLERMVVYCSDFRLELRTMTVDGMTNDVLSATFEFDTKEDANKFRAKWSIE